VLVQPSPLSTKMLAVLSVTLEGQFTPMPKSGPVFTTVLPITALPRPIDIPPLLSLTKLPVTIPLAIIATVWKSNPATILPLTIPLASIPIPEDMKLMTRNPSTTEPSAESTTPEPKSEIDPFPTAMPRRLAEEDCAAIAVAKFSPVTVVWVTAVIVKPARSIVTKSAVIDRQVPSRPVKLRFLTSL